MKLTFKSLQEMLTQERQDGRTLVDLSMRTDTVFCQSLVSTGMLAAEQMQRAARRYRLGRSRDGGVVFWEIDEEQRIRDGKIMFYRDDCHRDKAHEPSWVTSRLKAQGDLASVFEPQRCLFGLHLINETKIQEIEKINLHNPKNLCLNNKTIAVVEAEKTAVICSELFPEYVWMAAGGQTMLNAAKLYPLRERKVVLFPDTDPEGKTWEDWRQKAEAAQGEFSHPIRVSRILEQHATEEQKARKIDIVDLLFDS